MEHDSNVPAPAEPVAKDKNTLGALLANQVIQKKFTDVLGQKAPGFISSILSAVNANAKLKSCDPMSVISAAAIAAALDLPINPSLAFAHIVPYGGVATFQMGWRGFVQLAQRTGLYKTMNVSPVCEGELLHENRFTGECEFSHEAKKSEKIIGYVAYFKLSTGFEKYLYMTTEEIQAHGKRYSPSYNKEDGMWKKHTEAMSMKTPIKRLLSKWGVLSIEMVTAIEADQAAIGEGGSYDYVDTFEKDRVLPDKGVKALKKKLAETEQPAPAPVPVHTKPIPDDSDVIKEVETAWLIPPNTL